MNIRTEVKNLKNEITSYRRKMHENPQIAYKEEFAMNLIVEKLSAWGIPFQTGFATTGVVASIEGKRNDSGKAIGLRADMDALEILEENTFEWKSGKDGFMHACGHDGHTAMLLGAAKYLSQTRNFNGRVNFIFQPAEEGKLGAVAMIKDGLFQAFPCDKIYGMHNWPYLPKGTFAMCPGPILACSDIFELTIMGKGGHAAIPHKTVDPIVIGSHIISALQLLVSRYIDPSIPAVLSITNFNAGTGAHNIIPEAGKLKGSVRTFDQNTRQFIEDKIEEIAKRIGSAFGATVEYSYKRNLEPTINEVNATHFCAAIAKRIVGEDQVDDEFTPVLAGEDFGAMLQEQSGCFVMIGQGDPDRPDSIHSQGLHSARYDFNDDIIPTGIEYWVSLVEEAMPL
ncbi:MAG: M20 aminoacylase family protein [Bacteroidota bacterium]